MPPQPVLHGQVWRAATDRDQRRVTAEPRSTGRGRHSRIRMTEPCASATDARQLHRPERRVRIGTEYGPSAPVDHDQSEVSLQSNHIHKNITISDPHITGKQTLKE